MIWEKNVEAGKKRVEKVQQNFKNKCYVVDSSMRTSVRAVVEKTNTTKYNSAATIDQKNALARVRNAGCVAPKKKGARPLVC